jgi:hypothetical protein
MTLGISGLVPHWTMDANVIVHLDDRAAWRDIRTDRLATNSDIRSCLAALDALLLRGSFYAGPERTFLKNVTLNGPQSTVSAVDSSSATISGKAINQTSIQCSDRDHLVLQVIDTSSHET